MPLRPASLAVALVLALNASASVAAVEGPEAPDQGTEFGGMITGPRDVATAVLQSLAVEPHFRWIRTDSRHPVAEGLPYQRLGDVRYHIGQPSAPPESLPDDLFQVYWNCRTNLPSGPTAPHVWETWNEPDFYFVQDNAADMAAVLKAAWWGVKTARPGDQVLMPSLAFTPSRYALELAANGLASWTDGLNLHFYGRAADYSAFLAQHRAFARAIDLRGPTWLTEIGYLRLQPAEAELPEGLARQAAFHERTMIESWVSGVDRHLLFTLTPYTETRNDLGLTGPGGRWRPALASATTLSRLLRETTPRWRLIHEESGEDLGIVLERDSHAWWTVLWSPARPFDPAPPSGDRRRPVPDPLVLDVSWPTAIEEIGVGFEGAVTLTSAQLPALEVSEQRNLHLFTPPVPYQIRGCRWVPWGSQERERHAPFISPAARAELASVPPRRAPSPVVVRLRGDAPIRPHKPSQTWRVPAGQDCRAHLELYNFTDQPRTGTWQAIPPPGFVVSTNLSKDQTDPAGVLLRGQSTVPPLARLVIPLTLRALALAPDAATPETVRLGATWVGDDGAVDQLSLRLELESPSATGPFWHQFELDECLPRPGQVGVWQMLPATTPEGPFDLEIHAPEGPNREVSIHLPLPPGRRASDTFSVTLRARRAVDTVYAQVFLATPDGQVWRHGELEPVTSTGLQIDARLGDFSPTIWSRHRTFLLPPVAEATWLTLYLQGASAGDVVEIGTMGMKR